MKSRRVGEPDGGHRWQTSPTTAKRGSQAASVTKEDKHGWRLAKDSRDSERKQPVATKIREYRVKSGYRDRSRKRREPTSSNNRQEEELGHRAGIRSCLGHIAENHMSNGKDGKSIFKATELCEIWSLVYRTLTCPDEKAEDKSSENRLVVKKIFDTSIGVHGFTRAKCYTVKVVYDRPKRRPITAYPTHS